MRTLLVCFILCLAACKGGDSSQADTQTLFKKWQVDATSGYTDSLDLTNCSIGTCPATYIDVNETCQCTATISGVSASGSISIDNCTHTSGSVNICDGTTHFESLTYQYSTGGTLYLLSLSTSTRYY